MQHVVLVGAPRGLLPSGTHTCSPMASLNSICWPSLTGTGCQLTTCTKKHDVQRCKCGIPIPIAQQNEHIRGKRHAKAIKALQATAQNETPTHASNPQVKRNYDNFKHCDACEKDIPAFRWGFHLDRPEHLRMKRLLATRAALDHAAQDKNGIEVSGETVGIDFGIVEPDNALGSHSAQSQIVKIRKTDNDARISLSDFRLTCSGKSTAQSSR